MRKALTGVLVTTVWLLGNAAIVAAGDFCLSAAGNILVLKSFALPGKGVCKETRGFYEATDSWVTGMACGSSDLDHVTFFHTVMNDAGTIVLTEKFALDRTTLSGSGRFCLLTGGGCGDILNRTKVDCSPKTVPVP